MTPLGLVVILSIIAFISQIIVLYKYRNDMIQYSKSILNREKNLDEERRQLERRRRELETVKTKASESGPLGHDSNSNRPSVEEMHPLRKSESDSTHSATEKSPARSDH
jgi:hypothetical protein